MAARNAFRPLITSIPHSPRSTPLAYRYIPSSPSSSVVRSASTFPRFNHRRQYSTEKDQVEGSQGDKAEDVKKQAEKVESAAEDVARKVADLESQIKELKSQLTYGRADFINLQKRTETEKAQAKDYAIQNFASDLLSTIDILTTALKYVKQPIPAENPELQSLYNGVDMTKQELLKTLAKHGVTPFDPSLQGEKFDPNTMEAMYMAPVPGKEPGSVLDCSKLGYMLKNRTLRAAQVGIVQEVS